MPRFRRSGEGKAAPTAHHLSRHAPCSALAIALAWNWNSSGWGWDGYFAGGDSPGPADVAPANAAAMQALNGTPELAAAAFAAPAEPATRTAAVAAFAARYYNGVPGDRDLWEEERVVEPVYRRREIQVDHSCAVHDPVAPFPPQGINPVEFWAVWEGWWFFEEDHYRFTATARDGVRLYVDGALIVDEWTVKAAPEATSALKTLRCGRHLVRIEYFTRAARRTGALPAIPEATPVSTWRDTARDFSRCQLRVRWERDPHRLKMCVFLGPVPQNTGAHALAPSLLLAALSTTSRPGSTSVSRCVP